MPWRRWSCRLTLCPTSRLAGPIPTPRCSSLCAVPPPSSPHFALTEENEAAVAAICRRLDGLPLAIELAAAHLRLLTPAALLRRLDRRLALLAGGARDLPARQQTLRATLDWSFRLLNGREQRVFARLGVFVNGATLEAIEVVCGTDASEATCSPRLRRCSNRAFSTASADRDGEPRIAMLETIREYALEQLGASGEEAAIRARHAAYYLGLAEAAAPRLRSAEQVRWLDWLEADHDNLRAAGDWLHRARQDRGGAAPGGGAALVLGPARLP